MRISDWSSDVCSSDLGDRDFGRQDVVEDMIVAQIGVREDVIADPLAGAQPAAMADHQPGVGAYHREMIGDRLGIRRADADVYGAGPRAIGCDELIGGTSGPARTAVGANA